ncbi:hypothetical protein [Corynebacterium sp. p3-SID1194]|uniref:hypothetical protein n=1 Tax=Corynebacterium sp. p3-SID1194 TaxID=2916105 RepID=UPI0021A8FE80|nr:hypothetical protein [Corynebacterium sp. p3-SID1194]MCT1450621.1 hypothetical protein [Corynebacterium sp. p3-SID1194]
MTLHVVFLYLAFVGILIAIGWLTSRIRQHEDLLLDLRFRINDIREAMASKGGSPVFPQNRTTTNDEIARYIDQLGKETHRGHDR